MSVSLNFDNGMGGPRDRHHVDQKAGKKGTCQRGRIVRLLSTQTALRERLGKRGERDKIGNVQRKNKKKTHGGEEEDSTADDVPCAASVLMCSDEIMHTTGDGGTESKGTEWGGEPNCSFPKARGTAIEVDAIGLGPTLFRKDQGQLQDGQRHQETRARK